ncbi:MAG TPA: alkaline phosphatase D family protein [Hyphomicrobiaceae bacterium]|nr:alkaline phosphatase D family protein [Hyphomicrobiaceae bacterium]
MTSGKLNRRDLLTGAGTVAIALAAPALAEGAFGASLRFKSDPFTLGVASGEPASDGFVIWTRLAPEPFNGGGMPSKPINVHYEIATDAAFKIIVQSGDVVADHRAAHTVHVEVGGLGPSRDYHYRFIAGNARSPAGRARTLPAAGASAKQVRFGAVGCQRWEHGFFTAYRHLADEDFDFVFHSGDYIYEYGPMKKSTPKRPIVRTMPDGFKAARTLQDYRNRYALYKSDPDLQMAHASTAFIASFDDHEVANDWKGQFEEGKIEPSPSPAFLKRRSAALQAWYEHMPVRRTMRPRRSIIQSYRSFVIGRLMTLNILDTRQFRTGPACDGGWQACPDAANPKRSLLGAAQERWLYDQFANSTTRWNALAQQVLMMRLNRSKIADEIETHMDKWDGAVAGRDRLFRAALAARLPGLVTLTGDIHNNWAGDLKLDFADPASQTIGVEFVATSISAGGNGADTKKSFKRLQGLNPHIKFYNNQRGYVRHTVTPERWQADFRILETVSVRDAPIKTRISLVSNRKSPGIRKL